MAAKGAKLPGWQKAALGMGAESPQPEAERRARTCSVQPDPKGNAQRVSAGGRMLLPALVPPRAWRCGGGWRE
jgi:hypothetical protein